MAGNGVSKVISRRLPPPDDSDSVAESESSTEPAAA
jgi:hypothetical protein